MDVDTRTVWLNADRPDVTAPSLVIHEAWHQLETSDPDLAAEVTQHFKQLIKQGGIDVPGFTKFLEGRGYQVEDISTGEMLAHIAEDFGFDPQFWEAAFKKDPGLGARTLQALLKWIDKIAILLKLKEPTITGDIHGQFLKTAEAVDTLRDKMAEAYAKMAERARTQGSPPPSGTQKGTSGKISFALDINPNKAVGMAASKVPIVAEPPPIPFATNARAAAQAMRELMAQSSAESRARGGMMVNLANPDRSRAEWLRVDPITARIAHAINSRTNGYKMPDPAKFRSAPLTRHTLVNADMVVRAKDHDGRLSPTWIKVYQDPSSPTGELWHFVVTDENGDFQMQYSAPSLAGTSAEGGVVSAAGQRTPKKK